MLRWQSLKIKAFLRCILFSILYKINGKKKLCTDDVYKYEFICILETKQRKRQEIKESFTFWEASQKVNEADKENPEGSRRRAAAHSLGPNTLNNLKGFSHKCLHL